MDSRVPPDGRSLSRGSPLREVSSWTLISRSLAATVLSKCRDNLPPFRRVYARDPGRLFRSFWARVATPNWTAAAVRQRERVAKFNNNCSFRSFHCPARFPSVRARSYLSRWPEGVGGGKLGRLPWWKCSRFCLGGPCALSWLSEGFPCGTSGRRRRQTRQAS